MIILKYEEDNQKKSSTGLIIAIVVAIVIIIAAAWFALSRYNGNNGMGDAVSDIKSNMGSMYEDVISDVNSTVSDIASDIGDGINSVVSRVESEYDSTVSSYNSNVSDIAEPTGDNVSSVPYSSADFSKPAEGEILKNFSDKELQYSKTFGDMRLHSGIDIACDKGTSVSACGDGKILNIDESSQYGTVVTLELTGGLTAKYSSLTNLKVKVGSTVKAGDVLGVTATVPAECNDKEHLHFEVYKDGIAVDPFEALNLGD